MIFWYSSPRQRNLRVSIKAYPSRGGDAKPEVSVEEIAQLPKLLTRYKEK
jgi:hypothetical protein